MSSYVNPQVDHNLYGTAIPQFPLEAVMQLAGNRQAMYDTGLAQVRSQVSSMLDMSNNVTSDYTRGVVDNYNKQANDQLRSFATADFSVQANQDAVASLYDPLLNDKTIIGDYASTLNRKREVSRVLSLRDSKDADLRAQYADVNLQNYLSLHDDLENATTKEEVDRALQSTRNATYTPYVDYKKNWRDLMSTEDFLVTENQSPDGQGYMVNYKGVTYNNAKSFLEANATAQEKTQMRIEAEVEFYSGYKSSGMSKGQYLIQTADESVSALQEGLKNTEEQVQKLQTSLSTYPADKKLTSAKIAEKREVEAQLNNAKEMIKSYQGNIEAYGETTKRYFDGKIDDTQLYNILEGANSAGSIANNMDEMAKSYAVGSRLVEKDESFYENITQARLSATFDLEVEKEANKQQNAALDRALAWYEASNGTVTYNPTTGQLQLTNPGSMGKFAQEGRDDEAHVADITPNLSSIKKKEKEIYNKEQANNTKAMASIAANVKRPLSKAEKSDVTNFINFVKNKALKIHSEMTMEGLDNAMSNADESVQRGRKLYQEINEAILSRSEVKTLPTKVSSFLSLPMSYAEERKNNTSATKAEKAVFSEWRANNLAIQSEKEGFKKDKQSLVKIANSKFIKTLEDKETRGLTKKFPKKDYVFIGDDGEIQFNSLVPKDVSLASIRDGSSTGRPAIEGFRDLWSFIPEGSSRFDENYFKEQFDELVASSGNVPGTVSSYLELVNINGVSATAEVGSEIQDYKQRLVSSRITPDNLEKYGFDVTSDRVGSNNAEEATFINDLISRGLDNIYNRSVTNMPSKNKSTAVNKTVKSAKGDRIFFSKLYLEQVLGKKTPTGQENKDYVSIFGDEEKEALLIDALSSKGFYFKNPEYEDNPGVAILSQLQSGVTIPITDPDIPLTFQTSMDESSGRVNVYIENPNDMNLIQLNSTFSFDEETGKVSDNNSVSHNLVMDRVVFGSNINGMYEKLQLFQDLHNFVQTEEFETALKKDITDGNIDPSNISGRYIRNLYNNKDK